MRYGRGVNSLSSWYRNDFTLPVSRVLILILHRRNLRMSVAVIKSLVLKEAHSFSQLRFNQTQETIYVGGWCDGNSVDLLPGDTRLESQQEHRLT